MEWLILAAAVGVGLLLSYDQGAEAVRDDRKQNPPPSPSGEGLEQVVRQIEAREAHLWQQLRMDPSNQDLEIELDRLHAQKLQITAKIDLP